MCRGRQRARADTHDDVSSRAVRTCGEVTHVSRTQKVHAYNALCLAFLVAFCRVSTHYYARNNNSRLCVCVCFTGNHAPRCVQGVSSVSKVFANSPSSCQRNQSDDCVCLDGLPSHVEKYAKRSAARLTFSPSSSLSPSWSRRR